MATGLPTLYFQNSTGDLEHILGGKGELKVTIGAGFHYLLAGWTALAGNGAFTARLFVSLSSLAVALILFRLGHLLFHSAWAGFFAALWWILDSCVVEGARQLRPDIPTVLAFLSAVWIIWEAGGKRKWALAVAGLLMGFGMTMHPVGCIFVPGVVASIFFSDAFRNFRWRGLPGFILGALTFLLPYAIYLFLNQTDLRVMLELNSAQRVIPDLGYFPRIVAAIKGAYPNAYQLKIGTGHLVFFFSALVSAFVIPSRPMKWAAVSFLAALGLLPFLGRDYFNFLYLIHLWPWLFLIGGGLFGFLISRLRNRAGMIRTVLALVFLGYGLIAFKTYGAQAAELSRWQIAGYDQVIQPFVRMIPRAAIVIGTPNAFPMVEASRGSFLHNQMYLQWKPGYLRYPVSVEREGSHVKSFVFNGDVLKDLSKTSRPVYFHLDMYDWAWNIYYPFGNRYALSFAQLRENLNQWFELVGISYSRQRGRTELWKFKVSQNAPSNNKTPVFVEGREIEIQDSVPFEPSQDGGVFHAETGARYWLDMEIRCDGGAQAILWIEGKPYEKYFDASSRVPMDLVLEAKSSVIKIHVQNLSKSGNVIVESARLRKVKPL